jgi:hypothetical protein
MYSLSILIDTPKNKVIYVLLRMRIAVQLKLSAVYPSTNIRRVRTQAEEKDTFPKS